MMLAHARGTLLLALAISSATAGVAAAAEPLRAASPDGTVLFDLRCDGELTYDVRLDGAPMIVNAPLGLELAGGETLGPGLVATRHRITAVDETYTLHVGEARNVRDHHTLLEVRFAPDNGRTLELQVRVYNDGVAFRYAVAGEAGAPLNIVNERTGFTLPADARAWAMQVDGFGSAYEDRYNETRVSKLKPALVCYPLTLELPGSRWMALTESNLTRYCGQYIVASATQPLALGTKLSPSPKKDGIAVHGTLPLVTPWRVILLGRRAGDLIESNIVTSCADPSRIADPSWIVPGKCMWDWWNDRMVSGVPFDGGIDTDTMLHLTEFAANEGIEYVLIDDGWALKNILTPRDELDLPRILEYARARGVKILLWMTWGACDKLMHQAFPLYEEWGVAGVKVDFMNADHEDMVDFYDRATELAARHKLVINFHGAFKPTGRHRTWPNELTREAVLGEEHNKWGTVDATHNAALPFTRALGGPMDYTPGGFDNWTRAERKPRGTAPRVVGTRGHTLAKYVAFDSFLQLLVDYPANYHGQPGWDFLRAVPTTWDETRVIAGTPGDHVALARRHGEDWYVGLLVGEAADRTVHVPLRFLGDGAYRARVWEDGSRAHVVPTQLKVYDRDVTAGDTLILNAKAEGGAVARIVPANKRFVGPTQLRHLVAFKFKRNVRADKRAEILARLRDLPAQIPEILAVEYGPDVSGRNLHQGFEDFVVMTFRDQAALERYRAHPAHEEFARLAKPYLRDLQVLDWLTEAR